jgi:RimJ/RimL family protein N-acetyltransferase
MASAIDTFRLRLRPALVGDIDALNRLAGGKDLERSRKAVLEQRQWWGRYGYGLWVLSHKHDDTLLGWCGLKPGADPSTPELFYGLDAEARGHGYATEMARAVVEFALRLSNVSSVWAATSVSHAASQAVLQRIGMVFAERRVLDGVESCVYRVDRSHPAFVGGDLAR